MMLGLKQFVQKAVYGVTDTAEPDRVRSPADYDGVSVEAQCPRCGPCLADRFDGSWVCGTCDQEIPTRYTLIGEDTRRGE